MTVQQICYSYIKYAKLPVPNCGVHPKTLCLHFLGWLKCYGDNCALHSCKGFTMVSNHSESELFLSPICMCHIHFSAGQF